MLRLILVFVEIAFHRRGPESLPSLQFLLLLVLTASVGVELVVLSVADQVEWAIGALLTFVATALDLAFIWSVLRAFDRERRFRQTMTAMFGVSALMNALILPLVLWNRALDLPEGEYGSPWVLLVMLSIWSVDVAAFVLSRALDRPYVLGLAIMLGYVWLSYSVQASLLRVMS